MAAESFSTSVHTGSGCQLLTGAANTYRKDIPKHRCPNASPRPHSPNAPRTYPCANTEANIDCKLSMFEPIPMDPVTDHSFSPLDESSWVVFAHTQRSGILTARVSAWRTGTFRTGFNACGGRGGLVFSDFGLGQRYFQVTDKVSA